MNQNDRLNNTNKMDEYELQEKQIVQGISKYRKSIHYLKQIEAKNFMIKLDTILICTIFFLIKTMPRSKSITGILNKRSCSIN